MMKPSFRPLLMTDVQRAPLIDLTHVSTFSGGGGSCLGFRLAGFRTLWANDLEEHARHCYALNLESPIDGRDIRHVSAADILTATGLEHGQLDVFEGSPPCTAFSTAGKRNHGWHQTKEHAGHVQMNIEDLFYEWLRLLKGLRPRAFVAENVAGLVNGVAKGYFKDILRRMRTLGYQTEARLLDAQWLGVPQRRRRVIFIGIRDDLGQRPKFPDPLPYHYTVHEALPWINEIQGGSFASEWMSSTVPMATVSMTDGTRQHRSQVGARVIHDTSGVMSKGDVTNRSAVPVTAQGHGQFKVVTGTERRKFTIDELKRICSFPDDYRLEGSYAAQWARLGNSVPPLMAAAIAGSVRDVLLCADANRSPQR